MNWEAVGAIAEILGSLTVIGTIIYLAIQVRHAAAVAKATARQSAAQMSIDAAMVSLDSQILSRAAMKATKEEELTPEELSNYIRWVWVRMRAVENSYYQYRQGLLDSDIWRGNAYTIVGHLGAGSVAEPHWDRISMAYSDSFVDEITRILEWANMRGDNRPKTWGRAEFIAMLEEK